MPLIDASFPQKDGGYDSQALSIYGPTTQVIVGQSDSTQNRQDGLKTQVVPALIDTGACLCMIDSCLAEELDLIVVDKMAISGVGGIKDHSVYAAEIVIPQLDIHQFGRFVGADLVDGGQEHKVLLGRDFLSQTIMIYDGIRAQVTIAAAKK